MQVEEQMDGEDNTEVVQSSPSNDYEQVAISKGWKPKEEFKGDISDWRPAKEWLDRGELLDQLSDLRKKHSKSETVLRTIAEQNEKLAQMLAQEQQKKLENELQAAAEIGDAEQVKSINAAIIKHQKEVDAIKIPEISEDKSAVDDFIQRNGSWFRAPGEHNAKMTQYAIEYDSHLLNTLPSISPPDRMKLVEEAVKKEFETNNQRAPVMNKNHNVTIQEESVSRQRKDKELTYDGLDKDEKDAYNAVKDLVGARFNEKNYLASVTAVRAGTVPAGRRD
jgi:hypothetical protein